MALVHRGYWTSACSCSFTSLGQNFWRDEQLLYGMFPKLAHILLSAWICIQQKKNRSVHMCVYIHILYNILNALYIYIHIYQIPLPWDSCRRFLPGFQGQLVHGALWWSHTQTPLLLFQQPPHWQALEGEIGGLGTETTVWTSEKENHHYLPGTRWEAQIQRQCLAEAQWVLFLVVFERG